MVAPRYAGEAVVSCQPQKVIQPKNQETPLKYFLGASSAAHLYCAAEVGDLQASATSTSDGHAIESYIEAYSARLAHVQRVPTNANMKP